MTKLKVLSLFAGIGGFDLGLERTGGFETVAVCEINPFCRSVLKRHWPKAKQYEDVRDLTAETLRGDGIAVDVICGGFPCQDISLAGHQKGIEDGTRSGLYVEVIRLIRELRPTFTLMENVTALLSGPSNRPGQWMGRVLGDLASIGHDAEWHRRPDRVHIVLRNALPLQEDAGCIGSVDFEAGRFAAMRLGQPHVVEHGGGVEQLGVIGEAATLARHRAEQIDAA
ncbi:DNA cytosine methyltransferase [Nitratireductor aquimarinus]|nr:DNA cytosine methyltransferase [Nitratireductor aquimarinus]MBY6130125.1 DNA cytosine methyltransferase [Nitratireductor aquimarinus]